jgi:hypothetical protein
MRRSSLTLALLLACSVLAAAFALVGGPATTARADTVPAWTSLGKTPSGVSFARQGVGAVTVGSTESIFAVDANGKVWRNTRDLSSSGSGWSGFAEIATDGTLTSGVTAASTSDGRIFLFGRGQVLPGQTNHGTYYTFSDTAGQNWHTWRPLGGDTNFTPAAVMFTQFKQLCVFVTGTGNFAGQVFESVHTYNVGDDPNNTTTWGPWTAWKVPTGLSTYVIAGAPSATVRPVSNQVSLLGYASDFSLREARYTSSTQSWGLVAAGGCHSLRSRCCRRADRCALRVCDGHPFR